MKILILCALYQEAAPLIRKLELKKADGRHGIDIYIKNDVMLGIIGTGPVRAAAGTAVLLERIGSDSQILISYGSSAFLREFQPDSASSYTGVLFQLNKITNADSDRTFYPDMIWNTGLPEAEGFTGSRIMYSTDPGMQNMPGSARTASESPSETGTADVRADTQRAAVRQNSPILYDMESAAIYQAGAMFLRPDQMMFLRFVSDDGSGEKVTPKLLEELSTGCAGEAAQIVRGLEENFSRKEHQSSILCNEPGTSHGSKFDKTKPPAESEQLPQTCGDFNGQECRASLRDDDSPQDELRHLVSDLHCSKTMELELQQYLRYAQLAGIDWRSVVDSFYRTGDLPSADRVHGKTILRRIEESILR